MKFNVVKYGFTVVSAVFIIWFYLQIKTFPHKVDRWFRPIEAYFVQITAKNCAPGKPWLELLVNHSVHSRGAFSAQAAFLDPNKKFAHCEIGYKTKLFGEQTTHSHRYRYASVTKLVTAAATFALLKEKKIQLNTPLIEFFPELTHFRDERIRQITIKHLLDHSAGFDRLTAAGDGMFLNNKKPWCPNDLSKLQRLRLSSTPGEKQSYSNEGFCLLGAMVSRVAEESYREFVEREFSLAKRNIKFIGNYYYDDEVRYDYRYEEWFNDSYLDLFDFEALSAIAGLSGSATALAHLLWDLHHQYGLLPTSYEVTVECKVRKQSACLGLGAFHYQPDSHGLSLTYHEGYLPGSKTVAVIDSFGGITVLSKSGADRPQENPNNDWVPWIYNRLTLYYLLEGKLPLVDKMLRVKSTAAYK